MRGNLEITECELEIFSGLLDHPSTPSTPTTEFRLPAMAGRHNPLPYRRLRQFFCSSCYVPAILCVRQKEQSGKHTAPLKAVTPGRTRLPTRIPIHLSTKGETTVTDVFQAKTE